MWLFWIIWDLLDSYLDARRNRNKHEEAEKKMKDEESANKSNEKDESQNENWFLSYLIVRHKVFLSLSF